MVTRLMKSKPGRVSVMRLLVRVLSWCSSSAICHEGTNVLADLTAHTAPDAVITERLLTDGDSEDKSFEAVLRTVRQDISK